MTRPTLARLAAAALLVVLTGLTAACETTPKDPPADAMPEGQMSAEILKPLSVVTSVVLENALDMGITLEKREFVNDRLVLLGGNTDAGERVEFRLESPAADRTVVTVSSEDGLSDPKLLQLLHEIKERVWG